VPELPVALVPAEGGYGVHTIGCDCPEANDLPAGTRVRRFAVGSVAEAVTRLYTTGGRDLAPLLTPGQLRFERFDCARNIPFDAPVPMSWEERHRHYTAQAATVIWTMAEHDQAQNADTAATALEGSHNADHGPQAAWLPTAGRFKAHAIATFRARLYAACVAGINEAPGHGDQETAQRIVRQTEAQLHEALATVAGHGEQHTDAFATAYAEAKREAAHQFIACAGDALAPVFAHRTAKEPHPDDTSAEAEAYAAVMAECQVQRDAVSRVWSVDRMERGNVPHGNLYAREVAESATADVQPLMSRAAEAEGTAGGAAMVRAEILPALVIAREAVEAYDAHRSEETRAYAMREAAAQGGQGAPVALNTGPERETFTAEPPSHSEPAGRTVGEATERNERQRPQTPAVPRAGAGQGEADRGELPLPAPGDGAPAPVDAAPLRAYMFNAGAAGLWVHVSGPRDGHVSAAEHVATTASVEALTVAALTGTDADAALVAAGWERCGQWDGDRSAPVRRAAPVAEDRPVPLALPAAPARLAIEAAPVAAPGGVVADRERGEAARVVAGLGWSREFADVIRTAAAGHLIPQDGGKFRAPGTAGRRGRPVKAERVRLLLGAGFLALDPSGLLVATADGTEALRMVDLAPDALRSEVDVMAAVRKARRARQWDSKEGQDANALPVLPGGGEEARRRADARKFMERWEARAEESRREGERIRARARIQDRRERQAEEKRRAQESAPCRDCRGVYPVEARCGRCRERAAMGLPLVDFLALPAAVSSRP
jgi:hypothetical protein